MTLQTTRSSTIQLIVSRFVEYLSASPPHPMNTHTGIMANMAILEKTEAYLSRRPWLRTPVIKTPEILAAYKVAEEGTATDNEINLAVLLILHYLYNKAALENLYYESGIPHFSGFVSKEMAMLKFPDKTADIFNRFYKAWSPQCDTALIDGIQYLMRQLAKRNVHGCPLLSIVFPAPHRRTGAPSSRHSPASLSPSPNTP